MQGGVGGGVQLAGGSSPLVVAFASGKNSTSYLPVKEWGLRLQIVEVAGRRRMSQI